ncbi:MAG: hypothetical protein KF745_04405 [Phycisphaeraceae bacterium]|nr:hypothetical protein [Phycisphaeraceae bacterium]
MISGTTRSWSRARWIAALVGSALTAASTACPPTEADASSAQPESPAAQSQPPAPTPTPAPVAAIPLPEGVDAAANPIKQRLQAELALNKIRAKYFNHIRNQEIRQIGLMKLRPFIADPAWYPTIMKVFAKQDREAREGVVNLLIEQATEEADATIAFGAITDDDPWFREMARQKLAERAAATGEVPMMVQWIVAGGLKSGRTNEIVGAAQLAEILRLYEAIPMIAAAQVTGAAVGSGGAPPAIADIIIGTQQAFVADLTPVVGDSAVGFDPTIGVVTDGTVLRILGASVVTYRTEVHGALVRLADSGWDGRSTEKLGFDAARWREWYHAEFVPYRERLAAQTSKADSATPKP